MGQDFEFVSPSARLRLCSGGKLREILFNPSSECLVWYLAVPEPDSAQLPVFPSQNPEAKEKDDKELVRLQLKRGEAGSHSIEPRQKTQKLGGINGSEKQNHVTFSDLPTEVHNLVFEKLNLEGIVLLSLTNQYFFSVGRRHIRNITISRLAPLAGESIICLGDYIMERDYPPRILQDEEMRQALHLDEDGKQISLIDFFDECGEFNFNERYLEARHRTLQYKGFSSEYNRMSPSLAEPVMDTICPRIVHFFPEDQPWILRNLTTREYVRAEAIALKPEYIDGPFIDYMGFGHVLISRVCWSSASGSTEVEKDTARGRWAGHRFDITTVARHEQEIKQEEQKHEKEPDTEEAEDWEDISDEVAESMARIWECEFGANWREQICQPKMAY